jgi:hypothetical protein
MKTIIFYCSVLILAIAVASAQTSMPAANGPQVLVLNGLKSDTIEAGGFVYHEIMRGGEFVKAAPYTATVVTETTQVLSDGNRIVNKSVALLARDGEGRTRREETLANLGPLATVASRLVFIADPVARAEYVLDLDNHTARVQRLRGAKILTLDQKHASAAKVGLPNSTRAGAIAEVKQTALPDESIEGVNCEHLLETQTIPAGSIGNERPIIITSETCASPDLHLLLMRKRIDPRYGNTLYRLTEIRRTEPDASLFRIPRDYKVWEETTPLRSAQ